MQEQWIGTTKTMEVWRRIQDGYILKSDGRQAILSFEETDVELDVFTKVEVFLYNDKNGQVKATTTIPSVQFDRYDWTEVIGVIDDLGVFVDIGIVKKLLVSVDDLPIIKEVWPQEGDKLHVALTRDKKGRLLGKLAPEEVFFNQREIAGEDLLNKDISGTIVFTGKEGSVVYSDDHYRGFIHHTERPVEPRLGQYVNGRVIDVKFDGTVNVSLFPRKQDSMDTDANEILAFLQRNNGVMLYGDKSDPDDIKALFNMSKSAFKRALGRLMKDKRIKQEDGKTFLL